MKKVYMSAFNRVKTFKTALSASKTFMFTFFVTNEKRNKMKFKEIL